METVERELRASISVVGLGQRAVVSPGSVSDRLGLGLSDLRRKEREPIFGKCCCVIARQLYSLLAG